MHRRARKRDSKRNKAGREIEKESGERDGKSRRINSKKADCNKNRKKVEKER